MFRHRPVVVVCVVPGYGQTAELHALMAHGASMGISRDVSALLDELAEVKPTLLYAVPQLFKRVCDAIHAKVSCEILFYFWCFVVVVGWFVFFCGACGLTPCIYVVR